MCHGTKPRRPETHGDLKRTALAETCWTERDGGFEQGAASGPRTQTDRRLDALRSDTGCLSQGRREFKVKARVRGQSPGQGTRSQAGARLSPIKVIFSTCLPQGPVSPLSGQERRGNFSPPAPPSNAGHARGPKLASSIPGSSDCQELL